MGNLLYFVAAVLIIGWGIGFFAFQTGEVIHILLVLAMLAIMLGSITGRVTV